MSRPTERDSCSEKSFRHARWLTMLLVFAGALVLAACVYGTDSGSMAPPSESPPQSPSTPFEPPQGWTYYTNPEMGFSTYVPEGWQVELEQREEGSPFQAVSFGNPTWTDDATVVTVLAMALMDTGSQLSFTLNDLRELQDEMVQKFGVHRVEPTTETSVSGYPAISVVYENTASDGSYTLRNYTAAFSTPKWLYEIQTTGMAEHVDTVASIHQTVLDSFRSPAEPAVSLIATPMSSATRHPTAGPEVPSSQVGSATTKVCLFFREGPGRKQNRLLKDCLPTGTSVTMLGRAIGKFDQYGPWVKVSLEDGKEGWVSARPDYLDYAIRVETLPPAFYRPLGGVVQTEVQLNGAGRFEVTKNGDEDAVVILAKDGRTALAVYVRSGKQVVVEGIPDGEYMVYEAIGSDWDGSTFATIEARTKLKESLQFVTSSKQSTIWQLTIEALLGNAEGEDVSESDFPAVLSDFKAE